MTRGAEYCLIVVVHARDYSEDHIAHLIWGFMAIYHVLLLFPEKNDMPNFEVLRR